MSDLGRGGSRGGPDEWAAFIAALAVAAKVIKFTIGVSRGIAPTLSAYRTLRARLDVITWNRNLDAPPTRVFRFLEARPTWTDAQIRRYLRTETEVVDALMTLAGFERRPTDYQTWQKSVAASEIGAAFRQAAEVWPGTAGLPEDQRYRRVLDCVWRALNEDDDRKPSPEQLLTLLASVEPDDESPD